MVVFQSHYELEALAKRLKRLLTANDTGADLWLEGERWHVGAANDWTVGLATESLQVEAERGKVYSLHHRYAHLGQAEAYAVVLLHLGIATKFLKALA